MFLPTSAAYSETEQSRGVIASIAHWPRVAQLASFALARHGYGDTDGGFGVIYPTDFDEYERDVLDEVVTPGSVRIYGYWGHPTATNSK
jgi:hypothetical protein